MKEHVMDSLGLLNDEAGYGGVGQVLYILAVVFVAILIVVVLKELL